MPKHIPIVILLLVFFLLEDCCSESRKNADGDSSVKRHMYEKYIVFEEMHNNESSVDIIVKKREKQANTSKLNVNDTVFRLNNQENGFFLNLFKTFLFMDYGTGPDARTLHVYDIVSGKKVLDTLYSDTIRAIGNDTVSIWLESGDTAVSKCPEYRKWTEHGLGAAIISEHYFDLELIRRDLERILQLFL